MVPDKRYPLDAKDYKLYEEVGEGVSATVYRALCIPFNELVAIKVLDLERCNNDLDGVRREVNTMSLIDHPYVLRAHCSFTAGHNLWVVMPYMAGGSCMHIMKSSYPEGFEEPVIATLLRETLRALVYLHDQGHIHRDVKSGNILLDTNGSVKLADFGVSACMFDAGDRQRSRNTFVGTPCWMAPEVMQQMHGYDFKADIWSFGITALELAHGHAPFSKYPPMKVLLMTLQNAPPGLDYERDKRFSKSFKEMVAACLVKDPKKRPTSKKLLKHSFFKQAKTHDYLVRTILDGLPPLGERFRMLKAKEADLLEQNKALYGDKEHLSQQEYIRGISAWNFNLEDLKNQAALIRDDDDASCQETRESNLKPREIHDDVATSVDRLSVEGSDESNSAPNHEDGFGDMDSLEESLASFPIQPLKALKGFFDIGEDDANAKTTGRKQSASFDGDAQSSSEVENNQAAANHTNNLSRTSSLPQSNLPGKKKISSGPILPEYFNSKRNVTDGDSLQPRCPSDRNYSGTLLFRQKRENNNAPVEDSSEGAVVQRRGRFKVTSADASSKNSANSLFGSVSANSAGQVVSAASILPTLQHILHQNNLQREEIIKLIKYAEHYPGHATESSNAMINDIPQVPRISGQEGELMAQVVQMQQRVGSLVEELQRQKVKNAQLERQLNALSRK